MRKAWKIYLRDLARLSKNYIALMVLVGICVIPALYAWFNLYVSMDPYANTKNIKIAVVNNDTGTEDDMVGKLNAGAALEAKLRKNDKLGWVFTQKIQAIEGVKSGEYYAAVVIPADFSRNLASVFSKEIHQPEISYYTNMKKNAIAPKITDSGISTIVQGINEEFVASLTETVADAVLEKASEKDRELESDREKVKNAIQEASANTERLNKLIKEFRAIKEKGDQVLADGHSGLDQAKKMAQNAENSANSVRSKLSSSWNSINDFSDDLRSDVNSVSKKLTNLHGKAGEDLGQIDTKIREISQELNQKTDPAVDRLENILSLNQDILDGLDELNKTYPHDTVSQVLSDLKENNERHKQMLNLLKSGSKGAEDLYDFSSKTYKIINDQIVETYPSVQNIITNFDEKLMRKTGTAWSEASQAAGHMQGLMESVQGDIDDMSELLNEISKTLENTDTAFLRTQKALTGINSQLNQTLQDVNTIENMEIIGNLRDTAQGINGEAFGSFISSPVELKTKVFYPVKNYGSGMTPLFTNLAIWVGCVFLINLFKLDVDEDEKLNHFRLRESYFGRWFLFVTAALVQALIVCAGDLMLPGISCLHPGFFILSGMWTSFVYVNIVYALTSAFKHVGKALCVLLVILQIPGSSGTYPIQMSPHFFQVLHPFLPFTYGVAAMREAMSGFYGQDYLKNMVILLAFIPVSLLIGLVIRPLFVNLTWLFDHRMAESDVLVSERNSLVREKHHRIFWGARALALSDKEKEKLLSKMDRFEKNYPGIVRRAFLLVAVVPAFFLVLMLIAPAKLLFLILWVVSILLVIIYLLIVEYRKDHLDRQRRMLAMSEEELIAAMKDPDGEREET